MCRVCARQPQGDPITGSRKQLEHRAGNDPQRALGAYEQVLEVVAGVVLAQAVEAVPDLPVGEYDFQPEHQIAHVAVLEHVDAPGVGRQVTADAAGAFRAQRQGEQPVFGLGGLLRVGEDAAGLDQHGVTHGIDVFDRVHPLERKHDFTPGLGWHRTADQSGIAPLRGDGHVVPCAQPDHVCDHRGAVRADHGEGVAGVLAAPVEGVGCLGVGVGQHSRRAELVEQGSGRGWCLGHGVRPGFLACWLWHRCLRASGLAGFRPATLPGSARCPQRRGAGGR